jgi:hypothetical protein
MNSMGKGNKRLKQYQSTQHLVRKFDRVQSRYRIQTEMDELGGEVFVHDVLVSCMKGYSDRECMQIHNITAMDIRRIRQFGRTLAVLRKNHILE